MSYIAQPASDRRRVQWWLNLSLITAYGFAIQSTPGRAADVQYNRDIRPILADNCFACHGADSESREADLRLDHRDAAVESGAIVAGNADESELVARVFSDEPDLVMPPPETKKKLTAQQKELLREWITAGAEYQSHWAFIAPRKTEPPAVAGKSWVRNPIDSFVLARLEELGLAPAPEADPQALFRRLHLDITGLPPVPQDVLEFVQDFERSADEALSDWVDRLMKQPAWGEHRARYWLDAARYGDTHGLHFDNYREMWPYRDWVIRAFNRNLPFDRFTVEQLAGDLLPDPTDDQLIATGFQRCNITTNEGGTIDEENLANYASDRVQTFGWVYLGLTTNCGQCHDHKFDPFTMKDYYSLAAFFRNTTQGPKDGNSRDGRGPVIVIPAATDKVRWDSLADEIPIAVRERDKRRKSARKDFDKWITSAKAESIYDDLPRDGLVAHAPLNEGQGNEVVNTCEESSKIRSAGPVKWVRGGKLGLAPEITSQTTFELGQQGDVEKHQGFSYGAWVKVARNNASAGIIARMDTKASHRGWDLFQSGKNYSAHIVDTWPGNAIKVSTRRQIVNPGQWQHVFVTYDGSGKASGVRIYVNGKPENIRVDTDTLETDATIRTTASLRIGQRSQGSVFDGGSVQDVRVYDRWLGASEVKSIADVVTVRSALSRPPEKRSAPQKNILFEHFLHTRDRKYLTLARAASTLEVEQEAIRARSPITHIQQERMDSPAMAHILARGAYDKPGEEVAAATPEALHPMPDNAPRNRMGLARWLVDPANPLSARVTVNRFWQEVFGHGIVATAEDFGVMGTPPSHPELLDWLAVEFRESGWDVKRLFKLFLTSATYRQAAVTTEAKLEKDRDNEYLSRGPRFRMDAEMVRDYALSTSGLLSSRMYGPGTKPYQPDGIWDVVGLPNGDTRIYKQDSGENLYRRTVYNFWKRMAPPPNLEAFNAPSREVCTVRRERTNTPLQALVTLNDPQFVEAARHLAQLAMTAGDGDKSRTAGFIAQRVLSRGLTEKENGIVFTTHRDLLAHYVSRPEDARLLIAVGESSADQQHEAPNLAAWTMVCNQFMNLDEALNK